MNLHISPITQSQWEKIAKALVYSFFSGFFGTFLVMGSGIIQAGNGLDGLTTTAATAVIVASIVSGLNTLAVTIRQLFSVN